NLAAGKKVTATAWRGHNRRFKPGNVTDGADSTYWCTDDGITTASLTIDLGRPTFVNRFLVQEYIPLGQRIEKFTVEADNKGTWQKVSEGTTVGYKCILRFPETETAKIRFTVTGSKACPLVSNIEIYYIPEKTGSLSLIEVRKIWDRGDYNSFTDLALFNNRWYCTFREGKHHAGGDQGKVRVLESRDGVRWQSVAFYEIPSKDSVVYDLRDPKITVTADGRLMLSAGASLYTGTERTGMISKVAFSPDGKHWGVLQPTNIKNRWPWRPVWHNDTVWVVSYEAETQRLFLEKSPDGIQYTTVTVLDYPDNFPNETTLRFDNNNQLFALIRTEKENKQAFLATAKPPYREWSFTPLGQYIGGPNFLILSPGNYICSGRMYIEGEPKTCVVLVNSEGEMSEPLVLPSGGDTSYPGMVLKDDLLWLSYYSSHEGKAAVYLAKIKVKSL
ncbi:MAG: hypothetical protein GXO83_07310, partial [Chlorobi bacterium]|nr:hypothetical protein [Chlorobiota bacterium]